LKNSRKNPTKEYILKQIQIEKNFKILDRPSQFSFEDYEEIKDLFVRRVSNDRNVISIYQMGSVSVPGISDLDIIIVLKDNTINVNNDIFRINFKGFKSSYIFMHAPFVINYSTFRRLKMIFYAKNIIKLWGEEINILDFGDLENDIYNFSIAVEIAIEKSQIVFDYEVL